MIHIGMKKEIFTFSSIYDSSGSYIKAFSIELVHTKLIPLVYPTRPIDYEISMNMVNY